MQTKSIDLLFLDAYIVILIYRSARSRTNVLRLDILPPRYHGHGSKEYTSENLYNSLRPTCNLQYNADNHGRMPQQQE